MKKVLLSLSMLAAVMSVNAQQVGIGANDDMATFGNAVDNPTGQYNYQFTDANSVVQTAGIFYYTDANYASTYTLTRANGVMTVAVNKGTEYSVVGLGFGDDNGAAANGTPFTIDITGHTTFSVNLKSTTAAGVTVKVQFEDVNGKKNEAKGTGNTEYAMSATTTAQTFTFDISGGFGLNWTAPCSPCSVPGFDASKVAKINFLISGGTAYAGTVTFDNLKIGTVVNLGLGTSSAAANIASTKVFPNPTTGEFTAEVSLVNNANVTIIVTDMMGKQVASKVAANGSASFETAGLAKGMYTVTYVLDGTPAKTELVVVK